MEDALTQDFAFGADHLSDAMLYTRFPFTEVLGPILPHHHTIPIPFIIFEASLIVAPRCPRESALAMLHPIMVLALIGVGRLGLVFGPAAMPVLVTVLELADVGAAVCPLVVTLAMKLAFFVVEA